MKKTSTPLVDAHLQSLDGLEEVGTDDFFYTRLVARMERNNNQTGWTLFIKPVWLASAMMVLLIINILMLLQNTKLTKTVTTVSAKPSLQNFAKAYDQAISSSY
jgi:hypothetical protein